MELSDFAISPAQFEHVIALDILYRRKAKLKRELAKLYVLREQNHERYKYRVYQREAEIVEIEKSEAVLRNDSAAKVRREKITAIK